MPSSKHCGKNKPGAEYVKSYKDAAADTDIVAIAEEGMEDYLKQLD